MALPVPDTAVCLGCRYLLRGLENPVCPECGRRFDPDDRRTYGDLCYRGLFYRLTRFPLNWLRYFVIAWAALMIIANAGVGSSRPAMPPEVWYESPSDATYDIDEIAGELAFIICGVIALQHFAMWRFTLRLKRAGEPSPRTKLMRWWWAPLCLGLVLSVAAYPWPIWLRFQFSRSAMETAAKQQIAVGAGSLGDRVCGGYLLDGIRVYSGPVAFLSIKGLRNGGFVYSPDPDWKRNFAYPLGRHWSFTPRWGNWR